jgi:L-rhamnose mutarotase
MPRKKRQKKIEKDTDNNDKQEYKEKQCGSLPSEIWFEILQILAKKDLKKLRHVCHEWQNTILTVQRLKNKKQQNDIVVGQLFKAQNYSLSLPIYCRLRKPSFWHDMTEANLVLYKKYVEEYNRRCRIINAITTEQKEFVNKFRLGFVGEVVESDLIGMKKNGVSSFRITLRYKTLFTKYQCKDNINILNALFDKETIRKSLYKFEDVRKFVQDHHDEVLTIHVGNGRKRLYLNRNAFRYNQYIIYPLNYTISEYESKGRTGFDLTMKDLYEPYELIEENWVANVA